MKRASYLSVFFITVMIFTFVNSFSQESEFWTISNVPYFRTVNKVFINDNDRFFAVGGWEENDAITSIFLSDDSCQNWLIVVDIINAWLQDLDFPTVQTGYAVGYAGTVYKTINEGNTWDQLTIPGNAGTRNYNAVHFFDENSGIIAGGNESNDAIQTILKTSDGGDTWEVIADDLGEWIQDLYFINNNTGFAVGYAGTVLKTVNGGDTWEAISVPGNIPDRRLNSVSFCTDQIGIVVGGHPTNDSIQTIIKTEDGGSTWEIIKDNLDPMLNSVYFFDANRAYAVGDWGELLYSEDQGETWSEPEIEENDDVHIKDIFFKSSILGFAGGNSGKILTYIDDSGNICDVSLSSPVSIISSESVLIEGGVNPNGNQTLVEFEYGTDMNFDHSVQISDDVFVGTSYQDFTQVIDNLDPNTLYSGRLKGTNLYGTAYSNVVTFFTGIDNIPNFNFELWDEFSRLVLDDWDNSGIITRIQSYDDSYAIQMSGEGDEPGAILLGYGTEAGILGGIPFTSRPDSLAGWFKYDINTNDTAIILFQLKEYGNPLIADTVFQITGSTGGEYVYLKFDIEYLNDNTPDTLLMGIASTNVLGGNVDPLSVITLDNLEFISSAEQLPNPDMESWSEDIRYKAVSWSSKDDFYPSLPYFVTRTDDAHTGDFALKLSNKVSLEWNEYGRVKTGDSTEWFIPEFEVNYRHQNFYGYYKFYPENEDSLFIQANFYKDGEYMGYAVKEVGLATDEYLLFSSPINYFTEDIPDSASIEIFMGKDNFTGEPSNSYALIDNFSFDGIIAANVDKIPKQNEDYPELSVYPNPTSGIIHLMLPPEEEIEGVMIVDLLGKVYSDHKIDKSYSESLKLNLSAYPDQVYLIIVYGNKKVYTNKIIKQR